MARLCLVSLTLIRNTATEYDIQAKAGLYGAASANEATGLATAEAMAKHPKHSLPRPAAVDDITELVRAWIAANPPP